MYEDFFHFREKPFALEPSARFIVLSQDHREALATLVYAIDEQEGWAMLLGQPGVGKTTLIIALLRELGERVIPAVITNPRVEPLDFMNMMSLELGLPGPYRSKGQFLVALNDLLKRSRREGKAILLIIDEAHSLLPEMVEELRLLGNLDDSTPRVLNIFLVGQPELLKLVKDSGGTSLLQRLRRYHLLKPLGSEETDRYVRHRLRVAGGDEDTFDEGAVNAIHRITRGVPRLINSVCDDSLLLAYTKDQTRVGVAEVLAAAEEDPSLRWTFGTAELPPEESEAEDEPATEAAPEGEAPAEAAEEGAAPASPRVQADQAQAQPAQSQAAAETAPPEGLDNKARKKAARLAAKEQKLLQKAARAQAKAEAKAGAKAATQAKAAAKAEAKADADSRKAAAAAVSEGQEAGPEAKKKNIFSRLAGSMSKEAPGSFWKRLAFLGVLSLMVWGSYAAYHQWGRSLAVYLGLARPKIMMPGDIAIPLPGQNKQNREEGPPDWGPLLRPGQSAARDTTGPQGGGNG